MLLQHPSKKPRRDGRGFLRREALCPIKEYPSMGKLYHKNRPNATGASGHLWQLFYLENDNSIARRYLTEAIHCMAASIFEAVRRGAFAAMSEVGVEPYTDFLTAYDDATEIIGIIERDTSARRSLLVATKEALK